MRMYSIRSWQYVGPTLDSQKLRAAATRGSLRRRIADARSSLPDVVIVFRCVLHQICCLTYSDWQCGGYTSWDYRWKAVSREGFDILRGRLLGYGNQEYRAILQWLYLQDTECAKFIDWLADWWPELHPIDADKRKQPCLEMQGDVIEISLAALRGNRYFDLKSSAQPTLFVQVCHSCLAQGDPACELASRTRSRAKF